MQTTSIQFNPYNNMKKPTSNISEVLFELIRKRKVSFHNFDYMQGYRTRVSELSNKYGLNLKTELVSDKNKFGNPYQYAVHYLPENQRNKAVKLYDKLIAN